MVENHHLYILGGGFNLKNMRKSNWIMKPQTFGVETNFLFETYHLAEKCIHENYPPEKDHMGPTVHEKFGKSSTQKGLAGKGSF